MTTKIEMSEKTTDPRCPIGKVFAVVQGCRKLEDYILKNNLEVWSFNEDSEFTSGWSGHNSNRLYFIESTTPIEF